MMMIKACEQQATSSIANDALDCFTLIHHDVHICTSSSQFKMIMELVNNLVLYFRPRRKQLIHKQNAIKYYLQLSMADQLASLKQHIQLKQIDVKQLLVKLRMLERRIYHLREQSDPAAQPPQTQQQQQQQQQQLQQQQLQTNEFVKRQYADCKRLLNEMSDELDISISCFKKLVLERQQTTETDETARAASEEEPAATATSSKLTAAIWSNEEIGRRYEVWFKQTQWRLNEPPSSSSSSHHRGIAKLMIKNFLYKKVSNQQEQEQQLDCVEHNLEIEACKVKDLTNSGEDVLTSLFEATTTADRCLSSTINLNSSADDCAGNTTTTTTNNNNNSVMFRIYCKERPPVGIPVIEHLEVNVAPLCIRLTNSFYKNIIAFFFEQNAATSHDHHHHQMNTSSMGIYHHSSATSSATNVGHLFYRQSVSVLESDEAAANKSTIILTTPGLIFFCNYSG